MPAFTLCADDYAMTPGVTRGILRVLEAGRISATGAMTNRPHWHEAARALNAFAGSADLGVHLSLTCGAPLTRMKRLAPSGELPKLPVILRAGMLGQLPLDEIELEIAAQIDAYEQATGRSPDFIDGHQHVHALPGVRRAVVSALLRKYPDVKPYLRDPADRIAAIRARSSYVPKALGLAVLTAPFGKRLRAAGFATNQGFAGYSAFDPRVDFARDFTRYLVAPGERHLVMCHPGEVDDELIRLDPATSSRPLETTFLLSARFADIVAGAGLDGPERLLASGKAEKGG